MKLLVNVFFALALAFTSAQADDPALMTIRFNQKTVNYHDKLVYVVREALKVKPNVLFEVVDVTAGDKAGLYGQQIESDIENLGVPASQVSMRTEQGAGPNEEVRIFVR